MAEQENGQGPSPVRFNTSHYADFANLHADVVQALNNELLLMTADRNKFRDAVSTLTEKLLACEKSKVAPVMPAIVEPKARRGR